MLTTHYLDDDNNIVSKEESTHFIVEKTDENGMLIEETFGSMKKQSEFDNQNVFHGELTKEMQDIIDNYTDKDGNYMFRK